MLYFLIKPNEKVSHYAVENYLDYIKNNNYHYQVDVIEDYDSAVSVGEELFVQHFGKETLKERPFKVYYDESSTTWLISGQNKIAYSGSGGSDHAIFDKMELFLLFGMTNNFSLSLESFFEFLYFILLKSILIFFDFILFAYFLFELSIKTK